MRVSAEKLREIAKKIKGNETAAQRQRMMAALRLGGVTTVDGFRHLEIIRPAVVVQQLRDSGENIVTLRISDETEQGIKHNVGLYVLEPKDGYELKTPDLSEQG